MFWQKRLHSKTLTLVFLPTNQKSWSTCLSGSIDDDFDLAFDELCTTLLF